MKAFCLILVSLLALQVFGQEAMEERQLQAVAASSNVINQQGIGNVAIIKSDTTAAALNAAGFGGGAGAVAASNNEINQRGIGNFAMINSNTQANAANLGMPTWWNNNMRGFNNRDHHDDNKKDRGDRDGRRGRGHRNKRD
eukprot:GILJ01024980.1.p1 GENE.GILJ01024980.1~~GILJ01024980.1.p1  ORF type:complete len:141 (-),score=31.18 GILJ01024980.1:81-503(-)